MRMIDRAFEGFLRQLTVVTPLSDEERGAVLGLSAREVEVAPQRTLVRPGDRVDHAILVGDGLLARYDLMSDGARQITAFHITGDMCDLHSVVAPVTGWGIVAMSPATVVHVPHAELLSLACRYPAIALAFWRKTTLDASILAKWIANIGRKSAQNRVAHLLCEMGIRSERAGLGTRLCYPFPATQEQIGDATGLTAVHVNRMLRQLRETNAVTVDRLNVTVTDWDTLARLADFDPVYML